MTEQARAALTEAEVTALRDEYFTRFAAGDDEAFFEFFLLRGIDFRNAEWEVIDPPGA